MFEYPLLLSFCVGRKQVFSETHYFYSPTTRTQEACSMALINKDQGSILLSKVTDAHHRGNIPVHRKYSICHHQSQAR